SADSAPTTALPRMRARTPVSPVDYHSERIAALTVAAGAAEARHDVVAPARSPRTPTHHISHAPVHRRRRGLVGLVLVLLLATAVALGSYWYLSVGRYTAVPVVQGLNQTSAESVARANNLTISFEAEYSETIAKGLVTRTDHDAGDEVRRDSEIRAWISLGPQRVQVPTLAGLTQTAATSALTKNSLKVGKVTQAFSETVASGTVMSASLDPGVKVKLQTGVDLVVSKGPKPIPVPSVVGTGVDLATQKLEALGFKVTTSRENSTKVAKGKVISQTPAKGEGKKGDKIALVVSDGPVLVKVPSAVFKGEKDGIKLLKDAGFKVTVEYTTPSWLRLAIISAVTPSPGSMAPQGSTLKVYVS
ncbi:MAG TPA: PASTA domain-containing protein, partial [Propionibacteriaceae bacterium]|nr:PASTA domain-containing protein [Propionibacteriaceae bacterium]